MHKEWADKWVAALRSGEYVQGKDALRSKDDKYCCLGVLCEIAEVPKALRPLPEPFSDDEGFPKECWFYGEDSGEDVSTWSLLPQSVANKTGLRSNSGAFLDVDVGEDRPTALTEANDYYNWDFNKIADFIEKNYEKL